jgi:putative SOS response-associated peptidase YedK
MIKDFILTSATGSILTAYGLKLNKFFRSIPRPAIISGGDNVLVVTSEMPGMLQTMTFGYTSTFSEERLNLLNLPADLAFRNNNEQEYDRLCHVPGKVQYAESLANYRCIVLVDAFLVTSPDGSSYLVHMQNRELPFALAGIYSNWLNKETNRIETGFAILTTASNPKLRRIGVDHMPVILNLSDTSIWLDLQQDREKVYSLVCPFADEFMHGFRFPWKIYKEPMALENLQPVLSRLKPDKISSKNLVF